VGEQLGGDGPQSHTPLSAVTENFLMPIRAIVEGEGRLLGFLGANVTLGGLHAATVSHIQSLMPMIKNLLELTQLAVATATFIYVLLKIRRVWKKTEKEDE
jgi:hypothetical protein